MKHAVLVMSCALSVAVLAGCNIVAPIAYLTTGGPKVPARYELDPERTTVLFFDDLNNKLPRRSLVEVAGRAAEDEFFRRKVFSAERDDQGNSLSRLISSRSAMRAVSGDTSGSLTSIVDVGRKLGAEVVVYVDIEQFSVSPDGASVAPEAAARVKVFDAVTNERLWPLREEGYRLEVETAQLATSSILSRDDKQRMDEILANELGTNVAWLFFEHERERLEDRRDRLGFGN